MTLSVFLLLCGRFLIGGLFVVGGVIHFFKLDLLTQIMGARGVPLPRITLIAGSVFQTAAGLLLIAGFAIVPAAFGLIVFTIAASWMFLNFWDMDGPAREGAFNAFMTNIAIIGGLLVCAASAL
jgi:putative oxidoreductase